MSLDGAEPAMLNEIISNDSPLISFKKVNSYKFPQNCSVKWPKHFIGKLFLIRIQLNCTRKHLYWICDKNEKHLYWIHWG